MRKAICICLALLLAAAWLPAVAEEDDDGQDYAAWCRLDGDTLTVYEGLKLLGWYSGDYIYDPDAEDWTFVDHEDEEALFDEEDSLCFGGDEIAFSRIELPSTLERIGSDAFYWQHFTEFTAPRSIVKIYGEAFVYCSFGVFRLEAELPYDQIRRGLYDCRVYAWDVPADHPLYKCVDGALLSRDGKTLVAYPNGRQDVHWDVPAGVEVIGPWAFDNPYLKTVSLPAGLREIGDYAFAGCTRLQSVALPLTVEKIGRNVFSECVSLELVSLPRGLEVEKKSGEWVNYYDDSALKYRGDNGDTLLEKDPDADDEPEGYLSVYSPARLAAEEWVPVYRTEQGGEPILYLPGNYLVRADEAQNGRCEIADVRNLSVMGWVETALVRPIVNETLFLYAEDRARPPESAGWDADEAEYLLMGPVVMFYRPGGEEGLLCPIQEAALCRLADGPEGDYGIVFASDPDAMIPLRKDRNGETLEELDSGTQVKLLEKTDGWARVSTGFETGWVPEAQVKIIPKTDKGV